MYEKYLRNEELKEVERRYAEEMRNVACGLRCEPPMFPVRDDKNHLFELTGGFKQHPNDSEEMYENDFPSHRLNFFFFLF